MKTIFIDGELQLNYMSESPVEDESTTDRPISPDKWGLGNWLLYGFFGGLTLAGVALSSNVVGNNVLIAPPEPTADGSIPLTIPLFVYVYATLGALGYIFTKLMADLNKYDEPSEIRGIIEMGMRIPAAWVLGAGFYLVFVLAGSNPVDQPHLFATIAFLVGLYVNVAVKTLGSLADRMLGRVRSSQ